MSINKQNYEMWMVAFLDGELNHEEENLFTDFIKKNPLLKEELIAYEAVRIWADEEIVFENKELLYKKTSALTLLKKAWPLAAAVVLLLGMQPFLKKENSHKIEKSLVAQQVTKIKDTPAISNGTTIIEKVKVKHASTSLKPISGIYTVPVVTQKPSQRQQPIIESEIIQNSASTLISIKEQLEIEKSPEPQYLTKQITNDGPLTPKNTMLQENELWSIKNKNNENQPQETSTTNSIDSEEENTALLIINEENNPALYQKIDKVVSNVENKIEKYKELKKAPINVCLGKRKLFTINN